MLAETADTVQWRRCQIALMKRRPCEIDFLLPCEECGEDMTAAVPETSYMAVDTPDFAQA